MFSKQDFLNALSVCEITEKETMLLRFACEFESGITAPQVAQLLDYRHFGAANLLVGKLGKKLAYAMPTVAARAASIQGWTVLFTGVNTADKGFVWKMRCGLRQALDDLSTPDQETATVTEDEVNGSDTLEPQEFTSAEVLSFYEGNAKKVFVNRYERDKKAREACIHHYGVICRCCSFDFEKSYGVIGKNYIQVHHIKPISTIGFTYKINPIENLIPICSNCHAMIHKRKDPYTIDELKAIMRMA